MKQACRPATMTATRGAPARPDGGAAQADCDARILAALDLTPQPAPDVAGLVEAAKALRDLAIQNTDNREEWDAVIAKLNFALAAMEGKP